MVVLVLLSFPCNSVDVIGVVLMERYCIHALIVLVLVVAEDLLQQLLVPVVVLPGAVHGMVVGTVL